MQVKVSSRPIRRTVTETAVPSSSPRSRSATSAFVMPVESAPSTAMMTSPIARPASSAEEKRMTSVICTPAVVSCMPTPMPTKPSSVEKPCEYSSLDRYIECVSSSERMSLSTLYISSGECSARYLLI